MKDQKTIKNLHLECSGLLLCGEHRIFSSSIEKSGKGDLWLHFIDHVEKRRFNGESPLKILTWDQLGCGVMLSKLERVQIFNDDITVPSPPRQFPSC